MARPARQDFLRWARLGSALALVLDVLLLANGHLSLWQPSGLLGGFFDAQARALLRGSLAVPPQSVSFEGFRVGGQTFMYFGLVPALLRIPVLLVTHGLDGRLTQLSMLLALIVTVEASGRLHWQVRERIRPGAPLAPGERGLAAALALAVGAGLPLYLVSWPVVYHEAALWGLALALAALAATLGLLEARSPRRILVAAVLGALAVNTRISVGLGPVLTLGLIGLMWIAAARRDAGGRVPRGRALGPGLMAGGAAAAALVSEIAVNLARFGTPLGLPMYDHVAYRIDPVEHAAVLADHGAVFGLQYLPTTLIAAIRPDALSVTHAFPFLGLPPGPGPLVGSALFVARLPSLSLVTSMPMLVVLTLVGLWAIARRVPARPLALGLLGTGAAFLTTLTVSSVATRYLGDALPMLALGACAGLQAILARDRPGRAIRVAGAGLVALAGLGVLIDGATGLTEQRLLAPTTAPAQRAAFVGTQLDVAGTLGLAPPSAAVGAALPAAAAGAPGDLFVLGRCAGLYVTSATGTWLDAERGRAGGLIRLRTVLPVGRARARRLVVVGAGADRLTITARASAAGPRLGVSARGRVLASGPGLSGLGGRRARITVSFDPLGAAQYVSAQVAGRAGLGSTRVPYRPGEPVAADGARLLPDRVGVCRRLIAAEHRP